MSAEVETTTTNTEVQEPEKVTNNEAEAAAAKTETKVVKKRKRSKLPILPKARRTITRKTLKSVFEHDEETLLETIQEMVDKELIPKNNINLKKANIDTLVQYIPDYSTANVLKYGLEKRALKRRNAPVLTEGQNSIIRSLETKPRQIIYKCVKEVGVNIPNMYSMKKDQLVRSVATNEKGREILKEVRKQMKMQQEAKEKESKTKETASDETTIEPIKYVDEDDLDDDDEEDSEIETRSKKKTKN